MSNIHIIIVIITIISSGGTLHWHLTTVLIAVLVYKDWIQFWVLVEDVHAAQHLHIAYSCPDSNSSNLSHGLRAGQKGAHGLILIVLLMHCAYMPIAYIRTCLHAYMLTCLHACILTCLHRYVFTWLHAYMLTRLRTSMITYSHAYYLYVWTLTWFLLTCVHHYMCTRIHACAYMIARLYALSCFDTTWSDTHLVAIWHPVAWHGRHTRPFTYHNESNYTSTPIALCISIN